MTTHCGIIAIIGEPNAGKSTLINRMVGGKISIVTPKEQTTRFNVRGVCAHEQSQLIFIDTPGIFDTNKRFEKAMVSAAWAGMGDADMALVVLDASRGLRDSTKKLFEHIAPHKKKPLYLAINKIDCVKKEALMALAEACARYEMFDAIFMISALKNDGIDDIKKQLAARMPQGPWLYPEDEMSDIPLRLLAAEVTREKLFMSLGQELPYACFVETESWDETNDSVRIAQLVYVQREGQKKIVIGDKGAMLKKIGTSSRKELMRLLDKKVHLSLFVKVKEHWKDDREHYTALGLEFKK